jgi:CTP synthase (UTP-ammonia lyase)
LFIRKTLFLRQQNCVHPAVLDRGCKVAEICAIEISERHRHRYEVNTAWAGSRSTACAPATRYGA